MKEKEEKKLVSEDKEDEKVIKISPRVIHRLFGGEYDAIYEKYVRRIPIRD